MDLKDIPARFAQPDESTLSYLPKGGVQLAYQGHAEITLALLEIDPQWSWEPAAIDAETGGPVISVQGKRLVMWGYLTVLGVRRMGVGTCEAGKFEPEKELIGDFLRNAAMRFGVATKLWSKADSADPAGSGEGGGYDRPRTAPRPAVQRQPGPDALATEAQTKKLAIELSKHGVEEKDRHTFVSELLGRPIGSLTELTRTEASTAIDQLIAAAKRWEA